MREMDLVCTERIMCNYLTSGPAVDLLTISPTW